MSDTDRDSRLSNRGGVQQAPAKESREANDRPVTQSRVDRDAALEGFRSQLYQSALPTIPEPPGFKICWLTTQNPRDPIIARERLGYTRLKASDYPGFETLSVATGDFAGCIAINEMIAFKLPIELWEIYMTEAHHTAPLAEEEKLKSVLDVIKAGAEERGAKVEMGDGTAALGKAPAKPNFTGVGMPLRR